MNTDRPSSPEQHATPESDARTAARGAAWLWVLAGVLVVAVLVRLAYLHQIEGLPFFYHPIGDAKAYWEWSGRIAAGEWMGHEAFYQAPGYPYFLAVVRGLVGDDLWRVRLVQIGLGSISCALLAAAARRFFTAAGLWTGVLMAFYGPAIFFDGLIQKSGLGLLLMSGALYLLARLAHGGLSRRATVALSLALGVVLGMLALTVEQALILVPIVVIWAFVRAIRLVKLNNSSQERRDKPGGSLAAAVMLAGCGLVLGVVAWRNHHVGGVWAITTVQAGPNFYIGNHAGATGRYVPLVPGHETAEFERRDAVELAEAALGRTLSPDEVSGYWSGRAWAWVRAHPAAWLRLMAYKSLLVWNAYEIPDTESYTLYRDFSWVLGVLGRINSFGVLCPLALLGAMVSMRRWRELWPLYAMLLALSAGVAWFYVFGRYRYPMVPVLALFAGVGAQSLHGWVRLCLGRNGPEIRQERGGKPRGSLGMVGVLGMAVVVTHLPLNPQRELDALAYANLGAVLGQQGNLDGAIHCLEQALAGAPESVDARFNLGMAYRLKGDGRRALQEFETVVNMDPNRVEVDFQLGGLCEEQGLWERAAAHYRRALEVDPHDLQARAGLERMQSAMTPD